MVLGWVERFAIWVFSGELHAGDDDNFPDFPESADRLYLDIIIRRADTQTSQIDALDAKASSMFAASSTILPLSLGIYSIRIDEILQTPLWSLVFMMAGIVVYAFAAVVYFATAWPRPWDTRPNTKQWIGIFANKTPQSAESTHAWLGESLVQSITSNNQAVDSKIALTRFGALLLLAEVICLTLVIALPLS